MPPSREDIYNLIRSMHVFRKMSPAVTGDVAAMLEPVYYAAGDEIFTTGSVSDAVYIVYQGKVNIVNNAEPRRKVLRSLVRGDYYGTQDLLLHRKRVASLVAESDCTLLRLKASLFYRLLRQYPRLRGDIILAQESLAMLRHLRLKWINKDEVVYFITRRNPYFLYIRLVLPVITLLASIFAAFLITFEIFPGMATGLICGIGLLLFTIGWTAWSILDWTNDYYIITNQRVVGLEKVAIIYDSRIEVPLNTILSVAVETTQWGRIIGFGDVIIRTYTVPVRLRGVTAPDRVAAMVEEHWERSRTYDTQSEALAMESALRRHLGLEKPAPSPMPGAETSPPKKSAVKSTYRSGTAFRFLANLYRLRFQEGNTITYRKHWWILMLKTWKPAALIISLFVLLLLRALQAITFPSMLSMAVIFLLGLLVFGSWYLYQYWDWANDIYQVTPDQIIDIYRKPLGEEERKAAPLENILSITFERIGIIGLLLNFGTVTISVGTTKLTFDFVYDPSAVQQDIFYRMGERMNLKRQREAEAERERIAEYLATYHRSERDLRRLEEEQGKFTP